MQDIPGPRGEGRRPLPQGVARLGGGGKRQPPKGSPRHPAAEEDSWKKFSRSAGWFMGGAGALMGATGGAMTPVVGGTLAALGGQIGAMQTPGGGIPILGEFLKGGQAATAAMMMAGGAALNVQWAAAQPAMQHFGTHAGTYNVLGDMRSQRALDIARKTGAFTPDEAMQYARQLNKFGGYEGFGTMTKMRFGGFEPDMLMPFFQAATGAGAAGGLKKADYDYLAKTMAVAFSNKGLPSVEQAIGTLSGLMGVSTQYLADIDKEGTAGLTAMTAWMEGSGTALLRGQRGIQTMGGLWNWIAKPGEPAKEMFLWQALSKAKPGMDYYEMRKFRESGPDAIMATLGQFSGMPKKWGALALADSANMSVTHAEEIIDAYNRQESMDKIKGMIKNANPGDIDYKAGNQGAQFMQMISEQKAVQLDMSKQFMEGAMKIETGFLKMAESISLAVNLGDMTKKMGDVLIAMANAVPSQKEFVGGVDKFCQGVNDFVDNLDLGVVGDALKFRPNPHHPANQKKSSN